jgi:hypothetical protein
MSFVRSVMVAAILGIGSGAASAQFVRGNEAVKVMPDGTKKVETPPIPGAGLPAPCSAEKAGCASSGWRMVETPDGLRQCTEIYARPGTCRASTYGAEKRTRIWIVKAGGQWMQCQRPDIGSKCVSTKALPFGEVQ